MMSQRKLKISLVKSTDLSALLRAYSLRDAVSKVAIPWHSLKLEEM